jgi:hypothetical protein
MSTYYITDANGYLVQSGMGQPPRLEDGWSLYEGVPDVALVSRTEEHVKASLYRDYASYRMHEYPPIGDQLDALWKLIMANQDKIDLAAAAPLLSAVQAVKEKYPK